MLLKYLQKVLWYCFAEMSKAIPEQDILTLQHVTPKTLYIYCSGLMVPSQMCRLPMPWWMLAFEQAEWSLSSLARTTFLKDLHFRSSNLIIVWRSTRCFLLVLHRFYSILLQLSQLLKNGVVLYTIKVKCMWTPENYTRDLEIWLQGSFLVQPPEN